MNRTELLNALKRYDTCTDSTWWITTQPLDQSPCELWHTCERGDWLLWVAAKAGVKHQTLVMAACQCARLTLNLVPDGETRPLRCIEITEAWTRGEATIEQVYEARQSVYTYAPTAYAAYAAWTRGEATIEQVREARLSVHTYAPAANAAYAVEAAVRAAASAAYVVDAVDAAYLAVRAAASAAYAAYAANVDFTVDAVYVAVRAAARAASADAAYAAACAEMRERCAVAVRGVISFEVVEAAMLAQGTP